MKTPFTSVLLLAQTPSVHDRMNRAMAAIPHTELKAHNSSILEMNGRANKLAVGSDVVIFEAEAIRDDELGAIASMVRAARDRTIFVALTDENLPLVRARLLSKAGVHEIVPIAGAEEELAQILRNSTQRRTPAGGGVPRREGAVIAVCRARGGIGATTIAANVAYLLQERRGLLRKQATRRVAIVDLELQFGDVGILLDIEDRGGMLELIRNAGTPDRAFVLAALSERKCGLSVLPAPAQPVPLDALGPEKVGATIDALRAEFDYVVIDLPQALVPWVTPILGRARKILIATDTTVPGVRHTRRLIDAYSEDSSMLPIEVVVVHERRPMFLSSGHKEAVKVLERPLAHWLPHDGQSAGKAIDQGEPVVELHGGCELSKALKKMTRAVVKSLADQSAATTAKN